MQVMLLAAGRSTRLGALGSVLPKPLVPICGYPAISYGLALCRDAGLRDVIINLHHHGDLIRDELGDGSRFGVSIRYSVEEELLGTGGGIAKARPMFKPGPLLVMNAKVVANLDLEDLIAAHKDAPRGTMATMVLRDDPQIEQWTPVTVDVVGRVISIGGQRSDRTAVGATNVKMFAGIHILEPNLLDCLPGSGVSDVMQDAYFPSLEAGGWINSYTMTGYFAEHSTPERYLEGNLALLRQPDLIPHPPGPLVGVDPEATVDPGATVMMPSRVAKGAKVEKGATVGPLAIVGAEARVASGSQISRAVAWPKAEVTGKCEGRVVTS